MMCFRKKKSLLPAVITIDLAVTVGDKCLDALIHNKPIVGSGIDPCCIKKETVLQPSIKMSVYLCLHGLNNQKLNTFI